MKHLLHAIALLISGQTLLWLEACQYTQNDFEHQVPW